MLRTFIIKYVRRRSLKLGRCDSGPAGDLWAPGTQFLHLDHLLVGLGDPFSPSRTKVLSLSDVDGVD